jgi:hypothetical protein
MIIGRDGVWIKPKIEVEKVEAKAAKLEVVEDVEAKGDATNVRVESGEVQKDVS